MGTRDVHIFIHRGRDAETKHDPKNGQFAAGGSSGKKAEGGKKGSGNPEDPDYANKYNPKSVQKAIENNRTGKIGGKEAKMIHALLKGRH